MRRLLPPLTAIALLLVPAIVLVNEWISQPPWLLNILQWMPYLLVVTALVLCVIFYNSREFCLFLTVLTIYILLQNAVWSETGALNKTLLFNLMAFVLPLNFLLFNFMKERGLLNTHGMKKILLLVAEFLICLWLVKSGPDAVTALAGARFFPQPSMINQMLGQPVLLFWCLGLLVFLIHRELNPGILRNAWGLALLGLIIGLNYSARPPVTMLYFTISSVILITAIIIHAYHLAYRDELTQLPSRRALKQQLLSLGKIYSIAMVDVDHFKKLNDTYGHDTGDDVLKLLAAHLRGVAGGGRAFRYGGEEFTLVFQGMEASEASVYLNALREKIATNTFTVRQYSSRRRSNGGRKRKGRNRKINISVSIGVAEKTDKHRSPQDVIESADNALYKAKKSGRNRVIVG